MVVINALIWSAPRRSCTRGCPGDGLLPAVVAGAAPVAVVQVLRAVQRGGDAGLFSAQKPRMSSSSKREVRSDHKRQIFALLVFIGFGAAAIQR